MSLQKICLRLVAEGDTADESPEVLADVVRGANFVQTEVQVVGTATAVADGGPVLAFVACAVQDVAWNDPAALDKHQRRLHNSIRIS